MTTTRWFFLAALSCAPACFAEVDIGEKDAGDADADTDADSDADSDSDTDADSDADSDADTDADVVLVDIETSLGAMVFAIDPAAAPLTAENFLSYVDEGFFDGVDGLGATIFHRVVDGFVIQGGGYTESGAAKSTHAAIALESENGLSNLRGTIAMARTTVPDSATSQFYVNLVDNTFLDYVDSSNPGYAVFGEVVEGMDVVDAIAGVPTHGNDEPVDPVVITICERQE